MTVAPTNADLSISEGPAGAGNAAQRKVNFDLKSSGIYIALALLVLGFTIWTGGDLLAPQNLSNIIVQYSYILVLAIGMVLIIIAGHIDLSVGSVVAATGAFSAVMMVNWGLPWPVAVIATLVIGALIGAWQGYWVAYFGIPAFIVTLAGMLLFRAVTYMILGNKGIGPFPDEIRTLANGFIPGFLGNVGLGSLGGADLFSLVVGILVVVAMVFVQWRARMGRVRYRQAVDPMWLFVAKVAVPAALVIFLVVQLARFRNLPWVLVLLAILVCAYTLVTNRAVFGRQIYAVGGNLQAATLSGVKVKSVVFWLFVNMGVLSAVAGIIFAGRLNLAGPTAGNSFELDAIAAAFIGGAAVQGGVGKVVGAITGGLIMGVINNGMGLLGRAPEEVMLFKGFVLLLAVAFDVWSKRRTATAK
ncbi:ABC transporter permease [Actinoplanes sp. SE50]|uniref:multiple monosaccharide ABC transporter permease n=1 Tax=unclassified Actinoplanes TaxID=2626549 RepID=UPI00023ECB78|nr:MULTISPECIES: multiple monosaccharide ABC transporter permease [unclassified Actinoplanes]AEV86004.1 putative multiple sugar transport system permease protein [Actinoplanes sp. SE50/110]ATO84402.1 ABC transporter permease [Actinoplanes sp. SE50]SLM01812.1 sugar ABC transporter permease [Actinoplanes sp. SE50/110]